MNISSLLIAQISNPLLVDEIGSGTGFFDFTIPRLIGFAFLAGILIFVAIFITGAFQWITAGGDKGKLGEARSKITHAIIGLLVLLFVFLITQFINFILGINIGLLGRPVGNTETDPTTSTECAEVCAGTANPYSVCVGGLFPEPPPGCVNSGTDCHDPTRDCYCCPSAPATPTPAASATTYRRCDELCYSHGMDYGFCLPAGSTEPSNPPCQNFFEDCAYPVEDCFCCDSVITPAPVVDTMIIDPDLDLVVIATQTPTPSTALLPTNTPVPTLTPIPTRIPTNTPTLTPIPTLTPTPTSTPIPTMTPTRIPTVTPLPTNTPVPPLPTSTPFPTSTPIPSPTFTPIIVTCNDTDGGLNYLLGGTVSDNITSGSGAITYFSDTCLTASSLREYYCNPSLQSASIIYDCTNLGAQYSCQYNHCCAGTGSTCSTDSNCCSPNICNAGLCGSPSNVILNNGLNASCQMVCENNGFTSVSSMGTDVAGTNGYVYVSVGGVCTLNNTYQIYDGIYYQGGVMCEDIYASWTRCRCS